MPLRNLYLRIYLTIIAILTVFALVGGMLVQRLSARRRRRAARECAAVPAGSAGPRACRFKSGCPVLRVWG